MRMLEISAAQKARVNDLVAYAQKRENWYVPSETKSIPGDDPFHCVNLNDYRCVFTYTSHQGRMFRHLSISVPGTKYPNEIAVFTLATWFGFTGATMTGEMATKPGKWGLDVNEKERCIVVLQEDENV